MTSELIHAGAPCAAPRPSIDAEPGPVGGVVAWERATLFLVAAAAVLVLVTFRDYGITWDEDVHNAYGTFVLDYYRSGFEDTAALTWWNLFNYGAAFDTVVAALNLVSPLGVYETRHLLNGLIGVLGILGTAKLAGTVGGARAGFFAALALLLIPNWYGQMFNNPKDIPFAVAGVWSLYYVARIVAEMPQPRLGLGLKLGVAVGLALGVRVGGMLFLAYLALGVAAVLAWRALETRSLPLLMREGVSASLRTAVPAMLAAYPVMLVFWPWAQQAPLRNPLQSLGYFSHHEYPYETLFLGKYYAASDLPWTYLPTHIVLALPELTLLLALAAAPAAVWTLARRRPSLTTAVHYLLIAVAIVFPVVYAIAIKAVLFDGMRHFLFVLPPIAVAAALVADAAIDRVMRMRRRLALGALVSAYVAGHVAVMAMLHPNQYVYYNALIGGVKGAEGLLKIDYWANSYAEAARGLTRYLRDVYGADFEDRDFTVVMCGPMLPASYYLPPNMVVSGDWENADFFLAFTKDDCHKALPGKEIVRVERMGALLSAVVDRRDIVAQRNRPSLDPSLLALQAPGAPFDRPNW